MNIQYLDIYLSLPDNDEMKEILAMALTEYSFEGFQDDDQGLHCFIRKEKLVDTIDAIIQSVSEQYNLSGISHIRTAEIEQKNWNEEWEQSIQPIEVTEKIIITPSWHPVHREDAVIITIDPKMTFGTGYHESTRLMIRMMERLPLTGARVLDVGTGTGILAIAAVLLGARHAIAIDVDELSLANGIENINKNAVQDRVEIRIGSLETVIESEFEFIFANIIRSTIIELMDEMTAKLSAGGTILFAGLLTADRSAVEEALTERKMKIRSILQENDWIGITAEKP